MKTENKIFVFPSPRKTNVKTIIVFLYALILRILYRILFFFIKGKKKKYDKEVSVCAIFKNEALYLEEWIEYHKIIGVDHFYLYNNNSNDQYKDVLKRYIEEGIITLIDWKKNQAQLEAYSDCIKRYKNDSHWIAFIDIDEFIVPIEHDSIIDWIYQFNNRPSVKLYWNVFGTGGKIKRDLSDLVTESFTICWDKIDMVGKCLLNNDFEFDPNNKHNNMFHHLLWMTWHGMSIPPVNCFDHICLYNYEWAGNERFPIIINHYFTKSFDEYLKKSGKGDVFQKENPHTLEYMYAHERRCTKVDYSIYKYLIKLKRAMRYHENDVK